MDDPENPALLRCNGTGNLFGKCGLRYAKRLHALPRISISLFGRPYGGKTFYLSELWNRALRGVDLPSLELKTVSDANALSRLSGHRQPVDTPMPAEREEYCEMFASANFLALEATATAPLGSWTFLLNILDCPGGEYMGHEAFDVVRRRALLTDAFMVFLDVDAQQGESDAIALEQIATHFRMLSASRGVLDLPLALCLSKIDLLGRSSDFAGLVAEVLNAADPDISLQAIDRRHRQWGDVSQPLLGGLSPASVGRRFGERFRVFPLSAAASATTNRDRGSAGLFEPILWLLHESGYLTLP